MSVPHFCRALIVILILAATGLLSSRAQIVYDNSDSGGTNVYYAINNVVEYGDEVILAAGSRQMSQFDFEYYGDFSPKGDEVARLRVYRADGPRTPKGEPTPGTVLFDSGNFSIAPGYQTKRFTGLNVTVQTALIWTIEFGGLAGSIGDQAGLIIRERPSVGDYYDDFWQKSNDQWALFQFPNGIIANFGARITTGVAGNTVAIRRDADTVVVEWTGLSILQVADSPEGPFTDQPNFRNRYEINPVGAPMKFWRLRD